MATVPTPRFDLLNMKDYLFGNVQFSRGCPFQCEFCDIIVTFGRKPRIKTSRQILAELDALLAQGVRGTFIVDDNLIGNKKAIRPVLQDVIAWQEQHGYPMTFFTEASIDLADEPELMRLMVEANIVNVFVGIESPNEASLRETKKFQNVRPGGSLVEKVRRIQEAGMEVMCGMILGFDHDDETIFDAQVKFISEARVINVMLGMLSAIPKTPLYDRMVKEGRLDTAAELEFAHQYRPAAPRPRTAPRRFCLCPVCAQRHRRVFRSARGSLPGRPARLQPRGQAVLAATSLALGQGPGHHSRPGPRSPGSAHMESGGCRPASRVSPADLAARPGSPRPEHSLARGGQVRVSLPRTHDGPPDVRGTDAGDQHVLSYFPVAESA